MLSCGFLAVLISQSRTGVVSMFLFVGVAQDMDRSLHRRVPGRSNGRQPRKARQLRGAVSPALALVCLLACLSQGC